MPTCKQPELGTFPVPPVERPRLAQYLALPSVAQIDPITSAAIAQLDHDGEKLVQFHARARLFAIDQIEQARIMLTASGEIESTSAYCKSLEARGADLLIVAAFTLGDKLDDMVRRYLDDDDLFEAFVLKQWAATISEQARRWMTASLRRWSDLQHRFLMACDGPGYNGWKLTELPRLLELVRGDDRLFPVHATENGVLLPTNSMVLVFGLAVRGAPDPLGNRLAQCHRCAMSNCHYRVRATAAEAIEI